MTLLVAALTFVGGRARSRRSLGAIARRPRSPASSTSSTVDRLPLALAERLPAVRGDRRDRAGGVGVVRPADARARDHGRRSSSSSYFLEVLGTFWPDAKGLQPYSLFHYLTSRRRSSRARSPVEQLRAARRSSRSSRSSGPWSCSRAATSPRRAERRASRARRARRPRRASVAPPRQVVGGRRRPSASVTPASVSRPFRQPRSSSPTIIARSTWAPSRRDGRVGSPSGDRLMRRGRPCARAVARQDALRHARATSRCSRRGTSRARPRPARRSSSPVDEADHARPARARRSPASGRRGGRRSAGVPALARAAPDPRRQLGDEVAGAARRVPVEGVPAGEQRAPPTRSPPECRARCAGRTSVARSEVAARGAGTTGTARKRRGGRATAPHGGSPARAEHPLETGRSAAPARVPAAPRRAARPTGRA